MQRILLATTLGAMLLISTAAPALAEEAHTTPAAMSRTGSEQPGTDTWITTKVKSQLLATKGIESNDISVTTVNGIVSLTGVLDTKAQVRKSVSVAKHIKGVHRVDATALTSRN